MKSLFLTVEDLSVLLKIPKRTLYKFAKDGLIPGTLRLGKHWRFHKNSVEKWIHSETNLNRQNGIKHV